MGKDMQGAQAAALYAKCVSDLSVNTERWFDPRGHPSIALCLIDSIFSTGGHYSGVVNALERYRGARAADGRDANADSASDLLAAVEEHGGVAWLVAHTNRRPVSTRPGAPRKAEAVVAAARVLATHGLETPAAVRAKLRKPAQQKDHAAKMEWLQIPGQRSGLTWSYFLMLAGVHGVKPDRMIMRYVANATGVAERDLSPAAAAKLVADAASQFPVTATKLDHTIWRFQSKRPIFTDTPTPKSD